MIRKLLPGLLGFVLIALAGGCARFAVPETGRPPLIVMTEQSLIGQRWAIQDEAGRFKVEFQPAGVVWAKADGPFDDFTGRWRIDENGHICLKSLYWWKGGKCWAVYGYAGVPQGLTPQVPHLLDNYYPIEVLD